MVQTISSQMLKGILQGIMLMILDKGPEYGYGLSKKMNHYGLENVPKGLFIHYLRPSKNGVASQQN
nr:hypothetical protein [Latilactobacillus sakei]